MNKEKRILVDKVELSEIYKKWIADCNGESMETVCSVIEDCLCELYAYPAVDAVPVVRCGECKWKPKCIHQLEEQGGIFTNEDFCSYGERRE